MIIDTLLARLAPYECVSCGQAGSLICSDCCSRADRVPSRCYRCYRLTDACKTCPSCISQTPLYAVAPALVYKDAAKAITLKLKFAGARAAAQEMASSMATLLEYTEKHLFVPVPTASSRVRRRGYDQATLLARALNKQTGVAYLSCLRRSGQQEQLGASRRQRITQLQLAYRCVSEKSVKGRHIILVDDVLTTGATLEAAAKVIKAAGAARVSALVFAQA